MLSQKPCVRVNTVYQVETFDIFGSIFAYDCLNCRLMDFKTV